MYKKDCSELGQRILVEPLCMVTSAICHYQYGACTILTLADKPTHFVVVVPNATDFGFN